MTPDERIEVWLSGLDDEEAGRALLALGVPLEGLGAARANFDVGLRPTILTWELDEHALRHRTEADPRALIRVVPEEVNWRVAVNAPRAPEGIVQRLLGSHEVRSAFVAVERPSGSLQRRPWHWPLRIGLLGFDQAAVDAVRSAIEAQHRPVARLVEIRRLEDDPGSVDLLVVPGPLPEAAAELSLVKPIANAVLTLGDQVEHSPLLHAHHAAARAATSAVASAAAEPQSLPDMLGGLVYASSHGEPFDLALTSAARGELLLFAEPDAMQNASVPDTATSMASELRRVGVVLAKALPEEVAAAPEALEAAAVGAFEGESHEATRIADVVRSVESRLEGLPEKRWCQAYVGRDRTNIVRNGRNQVFVFIGPLEPDALQSGPVDESELPWDEERTDVFRLTVLFVPLAAESTAQQGDVELPRVGRSRDAEFELEVPKADSDAEVGARIVVLFRNRVLQTAVLRGRPGEPARLEEVAALVPALTDLDDRVAFDATLVANHANGVANLIRHSDGHTYVNSMASLPPITERVAEELAQAVRLRSTRKGLRAPNARKLLVSLARRGRDLFNELEQHLGPVAGANRIQLVTASGGWFLPIEILYTRYSPDPDARVCQRYLSDPATCDGRCTPVTDRSVVCPNAFWGLSKTIERHHFDPRIDRELQQQHLLLARSRPRPGRRDLSLTRTLLGASQRVKPADRAQTLAALGPTAAAVSSWDDWEAAVKAADTELLVLVPHTDWHHTALEIADDALPRDHIEATLVTGGREGVRPVVVLFGCRTTGKADDPAGFASRFMIKGAAAVFHSSTDLLNYHASELARRLAGHLMSPGRSPTLLSDMLSAFRRDAVRDGLIAALSISAFGDADWRI